MASPELLGRVYRFSLASLNFYRRLPKAAEAQVPGVQFYKAATSSWSNYRAAQRGRSRPEFIAKLGTVVEESDEAVGWLEFMRDGEIATDAPLLEEAKQLAAMFTTSLATAREDWHRRIGAPSRRRCS
jgi:four helix bundle protein